MASPRVQELLDARMQLVTESREFVNQCETENGSATLTEEQQARFETMLSDAEAKKTEADQLIQAEEEHAARVLRLNQLEQQLQNPVDRRPAPPSSGQQGPTMSTSAAIDQVISAWSQGGVYAVSNNAEMADAFKLSGCKWDKREGGLFIPLNRIAPRSLNEFVQAQSIGTNTAGGNLTAPGFVPMLEKALLQFGGMRGVSTILRTSSGSDLDMPTANDTGNTGALLSENTQDSEQDVTVGNLTLGAYKYTSKIVRVSVELEQDSEFAMAPFLGAVLGERLGRIQNTHTTTGTGSSQPNGIVTASTLGKTAASATALTVDELKDLKYSVDPAYRGNAGWMFNDSTQLYIAKLKDGNSSYYWQPSVIAGEPDRFLNHAVTINQDMASIATAAKTVLFGDFSKYQMREVLGVTLTRLTERYADYHQVGYVAIMRFDGDLLDAGTNPVKYLQQA